MEVTQMAQRAPLLSLVLLVTPILASADEAAPPKSILKVYRVGNIVSGAALRAHSSGATTSEEWGSNYAETLRSLNDLGEIVEKMCSDESAAVSTYEPTLSLIVRHTKQGHNEISELLESLARSGDKKIRLQCRALFDLHARRSEFAPKDIARIEELLVKRTLSSEEADELMSLASLNETSVGNGIKLEFKTDLEPGRRTAWGGVSLPCTAMGRVNSEANSIDLRIDFLADEYKEGIAPMGSQSFSLKDGESGVLPHHCDGDTIFWVVTAEVLSRPLDAARVARKNQLP